MTNSFSRMLNRDFRVKVDGKLVGFRGLALVLGYGTACAVVRKAFLYCYTDKLTLTVNNHKCVFYVK